MSDISDLDAVLNSSHDGEEVAVKVETVHLPDDGRSFAGNIDPDSVEGKERIGQAKVRITQILAVARVA